MGKIVKYLWIVLICSIALYLESPTKVASADSSNFSALNAKPHIQKMAAENHFMGTSENRKIRDYILAEFSKLDIQSELFVGNTDRNFNNRYIKLARTENIIATIKGSGNRAGNNKAILIAGHYDSVLSAPGAADDVHAIACMLETARLLKKSQHENDIIFLITDGEEMGLLGAKSFVEQRDISNIGLVLNYEARGNSGPSISFEWSEGNAWLVKQVKKVGRRPIANSLSYEIYNLLPNDTDFTFFKKAGLPGINHAFIDGFSYYHNPDDSPERLNMESVQHTGENMYHLVKHFANVDLSNVVSHNASFFNLFTSLIIYPASWDIFLLIITILLVCFVVYKLYKTEELKIKSTLWAMLNLIFVFVIMSAGMKLLSIILFRFYPQYEVFYAGQFYNHKIYIITIVSSTVFVMWLRAYYYSKKHNYINLKVASLILLLCFTVVFYFSLSTATYFMSIPTLVLSLIVWAQIKGNERNVIYKYVIPLALITVPLAIWSPVINSLFLAFSLSNMIGPAVLSCIICLGIILTFDSIWSDEKVVPSACLILFLGSLIWAHMTSQPTSEKPLPSSLIYNYNINNDEAYWISNDDGINIGNQDILQTEKFIEVKIPYLLKKLGNISNVGPHIITHVVEPDSLDVFDFKLSYDHEVFQTRIYIDNVSNIKSLSINNQSAFESKDGDDKATIDVYGLTQDSLELKITKYDIYKDVDLDISSRFLGLPGKDILPDNAIRRDGYSSIVRSIKI
jgi:hypothetical protein